MIANWLVRLFAEARLPDGVVQVITGRNAEISDALLASPDAVTFTGSNEVGGYLRRALADRNVRLQGELGGKNVSVVLADADLDMAAATVASAAFAQAGQRCTATSRLIVEASVAPALTERLRDRVAEIVVGPGLDPATTMGPLSYAAHRDGVLEHIERARKEGAEVIVGGGRPASDALSHGCYVQPTLINVTPAQSLWRDEVFGPVLAITTATGFDDAVRLANDTAFGLAAAVFTGSLTSATRFLERGRGRAGRGQPADGRLGRAPPVRRLPRVRLPFKEQGAPGLRFYTRIKTTAVRYQW